MIVLLGFHTASTLSGSLRSPPSPSGEGCGMGENSTLIFYLFPPSSGRRCPEGAEVGYRSEMKSNERQSILSYRHRKRSRGIFYALAVLCTYEGKIKSHRCCLSSHTFRLTVVQGRFLAALEMTRGGRTVIRERAFSLLAVPTFPAKRSHSLRKERLRNPHFPPILSAFSHREAPRGSSMDFFKNKRVSPHFLQI